MEITEKVEHSLQNLLTRNVEASKGYSKAAEMVDEPRLTRFFQGQTETRAAFGEQLGREMARHGRVPEQKTTLVSDAHRTWMDIKDALGANGAEAVLNECMVGDKRAKETYHEVLHYTALPQSTREMLLQQLTGIEQSIERMESLQEVYS